MIGQATRKRVFTRLFKCSQVLCEIYNITWHQESMGQPIKNNMTMESGRFAELPENENHPTNGRIFIRRTFLIVRRFYSSVPTSISLIIKFSTSSLTSNCP
jgi:hypothetical protein